MILALSVAAGCAHTHDRTDGDRTGPAVRQFAFTYETTLPAPPAGTRQLDVWVPLPHEDPGVQSVANLEIVVDGDYRVTADPDFGNRMVHVRRMNPEGETRIAWRADITRHLDAGQGAGPLLPRYLEPSSRIPLDGRARTMAEELGILDEARPLEDRARLMYDDVLDGMDYDKSGTGWGQGDFQHAVEVCKGNCTDFHARFIGLGRAARIPVRFTMGIPLKQGQNTYNSYHCWAHWHDGDHWRPVDISEADKVAATDPGKARWYFGHLGTDRIGLTVGRDITLSPPQQGEKLNYFVFPYAEADGRPMELGKSMWRFSWRDE